MQIYFHFCDTNHRQFCAEKLFFLKKKTPENKVSLQNIINKVKYFSVSEKRYHLIQKRLRTAAPQHCFHNSNKWF